MKSPFPLPGRNARGLALLSALILMLATMLVGVAVARTTFASVSAARYERERRLARGAAEAALLDAGRDIGSSADPARAARFAANAAPWPAGCGQGASDRGLCAEHTPPAWQSLDLAAPGNPNLVPFGQLTGAPMALGGGLLPARLPAYVIERLAGAAGQPDIFRITAIGFGTRASSPVVLQALYRAAPGAQPHGALAPARIGWREVVNWTELHARAQP